LAGQNIQRAVTNGRVRVQLDLSVLTGLSGLIGKLCDQLSPVCSAISIPPTASTLVSALLGFTAGGER
jgi:hypothetical protein